LKEEKWYKTKYSVEPIPEDLLKQMTEPACNTTTKKIDLPPANTLIPKNFDILPKNEELSKKAHLLKQWDDCDLWYKKDDKFERPKAYINMKMYTGDNGFGSAPEKRLFALFWQSVQEEYLREFKYMADCANLNFTLSVLHDNLNLSFSGFNDSMPNYISESVTRLMQMKDADLKEIFDQTKEKLLLDWKNFYLNQSFRQMLPSFEAIMYEMYPEKRALRKILEPYTYEMFMAELAGWLKSGQYIFYVHGNYSAEAAVQLVEQVRGILNINLTEVSDLPKVRVLDLQPGHSAAICDELEDKKNDNSCTLTYYQIGQKQKDYKLDVTLQVLCQYFEEPFFDDLRTKQQLGYVVASRQSDYRQCLGIWFLVQSAQKSCEYLVQAINKFLLERRELVKNISDEDFEQQKKSVHTQIAEKDQNMSQESSRFWSEISTHNYDFEKQEKELKVLEEITKEDFIALFEKTFFSESSSRLDFELTSEAHKDNQAELLETNKTDLMFTNHLKRSVFAGNLSDFKAHLLAQGSYQDDYIKDQFVKFRNQGL